jgi:hypothetical protein
VRAVESATESRFPTRFAGSLGHSKEISTSRFTGRPRLVTRILTRSRAFFDCQAVTGTGSPRRNTRNPPRVWMNNPGSVCPRRSRIDATRFTPRWLPSSRQIDSAASTRDSARRSSGTSRRWARACSSSASARVALSPRFRARSSASVAECSAGRPSARPMLSAAEARSAAP